MARKAKQHEEMQEMISSIREIRAGCSMLAKVLEHASDHQKLKNMMVTEEDSPSQKHIDCNASLISVRRSDEHQISPPTHCSKPSIENLGTPGSVPFLWEQKPGTPKNERKNLANGISSRLSPPPCYHSSLSPAMKSFSEPEILPARMGRITLASLLKSTALEEHPSEEEEHAVKSPHDLKSDDGSSDAPETMPSTEGVTDTYHVSVDGDESGRNLLTQTSMTSRDFIMHRFLPAAQTKALDTSKIFHRRPAEVLKPFIGRYVPGKLLSPASSMKERALLVEKDEYRSHCGYALTCGLFSVRVGNSMLPWTRSSAYPCATLEALNPSKQIQAASRIHQPSLASKGAIDSVATNVDHTEQILDGNESSDRRNSSSDDTLTRVTKLEFGVGRGRMEANDGSGHAEKVDVVANSPRQKWKSTKKSSNLKQKMADFWQGRFSFLQGRTEAQLLSPPQIVATSSIQKDFSRRDHILSPPLPQSPSEPWLCRALQQKGSSSPLASKQLLPKSPPQ